MKHLFLALAFALFVVMGVGQFTQKGFSYTMAYQKVQEAIEQPAQATEPTFARGKVIGTDCRPDFNKGAPYTSETVGKDELIYRFNKLGIPAQHHDMMASIAMSESIRGQISCHGDDYPPYYMAKAANGQTYTYSIGLFQIRLIKEQTGTGQCRDESRLKDNVDQQILCAWEISGNGKSWSPWSVTHSNRGKPYLNWLGKHYGAFSWDGNRWTGG